MATMSNTVVTTKVLIIEDDPNIVDLIRSNLAVRGFDTVVSAGCWTCWRPSGPTWCCST
jgi:hypothetical protein